MTDHSLIGIFGILRRVFSTLGRLIGLLLLLSLPILVAELAEDEAEARRAAGVDLQESERLQTAANGLCSLGQALAPSGLEENRDQDAQHGADEQD